MTRDDEPRFNETERMDKDHVFGTWSYQSENWPTQVVSSEGVRFIDADGNEFIDLSGQLMCSNLGHSASAVTEAIAEQAEDHPSVGDTHGVGLFRGIELTKRADERVPFGSREDKISKRTNVVDEVAAAAYDNGTYAANMINTLIIAPPLPITEDDIDEPFAALDAALEVSDNAMEA